jgi:hypothetical protein
VLDTGGSPSPAAYHITTRTSPGIGPIKEQYGYCPDAQTGSGKEEKMGFIIAVLVVVILVIVVMRLV